MEDYLDHAPCFCITTSDDGIIQNVNQLACSQLGYEKVELVGKNIDILFPIATKIFHQTHFFPLLRMQEHAEEIYITLHTKDKNEIPLLFNARRAKVDGDVIDLYVGIPVYNRKKFEDELISAKKSAELALKENTVLTEAREQLQHNMVHLDQQLDLVQKQNEELKQFNRVVTHDLQEPVRKLAFFASMLPELDADKLAEAKIVERMMRVTGQMQAVVSGLQQYVWLNDTDLRPVVLNLNDVVDNVQLQLKSEFPDVVLYVEMKELPILKADRDQVNMLFYHLLSNAIRFRKKDEHAFVTITADQLQLNRYKKIKEKYKYSDYIRIEVADRGVGFEQEFSEHVFELFKRLHANSGRGIGLALCRKIVENHGGNISVQSQPHKSTTFTIILPYSADMAELKNKKQDSIHI